MTALSQVAQLAAAQQEAAESIQLPKQEAWPELAEDALHGLAGRYVRKIEPHTEADPVGILVQFLVMFGNLIGRNAHFCVEADKHHFNLFAVLVGESSKGRKGVSAGQAKRLLKDVDPEWCEERILHGLSSGEGLIWAVRDPIEKEQAVRVNGKPTGEMEAVVVDPGIEDKRLLVLESEFASTLRVMKRDGNTLSATVRNAWDSGRLSTLTKNSPAQATGAHIGIIGHITKDELLRYLESTEAANGFGNRFLWCCVKRSKFLPEGGAVHSLDFGPEIEDLEQIIEFAKSAGEMRRDDEAKEIWANVYPELSEGKPGLLGSMIGRSEAQTMRLASLYALLDRSNRIRAEHLMAALALWEYCEASARWVFGDALGDPVADEILRTLRSNPEGLTRSDIGKHFSGHRNRAELGRALALLLEKGLVTCDKKSSGGRPSESWRVVTTPCEKSEISEKSP